MPLAGLKLAPFLRANKTRTQEFNVKSKYQKTRNYELQMEYTASKGFSNPVVDKQLVPELQVTCYKFCKIFRFSDFKRLCDK